MSGDEIDHAALAAVRERVERKLEAERLAAKRTLQAARKLRDAAGAAGLVPSRAAWLHDSDAAVFRVDDPADGWHADVCVIPAGLAEVIGGAIRECRERLAAELLGGLRKAARPDGTWPEAAMTRVVSGWLLNHGVNPDAPQ